MTDGQYYGYGLLTLLAAGWALTWVYTYVRVRRQLRRRPKLRAPYSHVRVTSPPREP